MFYFYVLLLCSTFMFYFYVLLLCFAFMFYLARFTFTFYVLYFTQLYHQTHQPSLFAINLNGICFCCNFMWTKSFVCDITFHEVLGSFLLIGVRGNSILTELNHFFYFFFNFGLTSIITLQLKKKA